MKNDRKWVERIADDFDHLPAEAMERLAAIDKVVSTFRQQVAKELTGPVNELVGKIADPATTPDTRRGICSAVNYMLGSVGLAIACHDYAKDQRIPKDTPCKLRVKSSRNSSWVVLSAKPSSECGVLDTTVIEADTGGQLPRLKLVEHVSTVAGVDVERAQQYLGGR